METASWPTHQHVPDQVKNVVARFYDLLDSCDAHCSSAELAYTIFAPTGELQINRRRMKGPQQIVKWWQGSESIMYRRHEVLRIYVSDGPGDLMMMGNLTLGFDDGTTAESPFCARCVVDDVESERPRIQLWQGWVEHSPCLAYGMFRKPSISSGVLDTIGGR